MSKKLSKSEIASLRKNFKEIDENGDGKITRDEFKKAYMKETDMDEGIMEGIIDEIWSEYDENGDGSIDFEEYCSTMAEQSSEFDD